MMLLKSSTFDPPIWRNWLRLPLISTPVPVGVGTVDTFGRSISGCRGAVGTIALGAAPVWQVVILCVSFQRPASALAVLTGFIVAAVIIGLSVANAPP